MGEDAAACSPGLVSSWRGTGDPLPGFRRRSPGSYMMNGNGSLATPVRSTSAGFLGTNVAATTIAATDTARVHDRLRRGPCDAGAGGAGSASPSGRARIGIAVVIPFLSMTHARSRNAGWNKAGLKSSAAARVRVESQDNGVGIGVECQCGGPSGETRPGPEVRRWRRHRRRAPHRPIGHTLTARCSPHLPGAATPVVSTKYLVHENRSRPAERTKERRGFEVICQNVYATQPPPHTHTHTGP